MRTMTDLLRELYALRVEITETQEELDRDPLQLKGSQAKLDKAEGAVAALKSKLKTMRKESDGKEVELKSGEARKRDLAAKLNGATNVKDFNAIKEEIARIETQNGSMETEGLELLNQQESFTAEIAAAEAEAAAVREKHAKLKSVIDDRIARHTTVHRTLTAKANALELKLDPELRAQYQRMIKLRGLAALAPSSQHGMCGSCHSSITPQMQQNMELGRVQTCNNCGAIIFKGA